MLPYSFPIILGSGSPRRKQLLEQLDFAFSVETRETEEDFPVDLPLEEVPIWLAKKKAKAFEPSYLKDKVLITADTVVILGDQILNKPSSGEEAAQMLSLLAGKTHSVVTGVCLTSGTKQKAFSETALVTFSGLHPLEIEYYINTYRPFDKAGAYGAQEWMGMIAIEKIEGSYFNVMGLPVQKLYLELLTFEEELKA